VMTWRSNGAATMNSQAPSPVQHMGEALEPETIKHYKYTRFNEFFSTTQSVRKVRTPVKQASIRTFKERNGQQQRSAAQHHRDATPIISKEYHGITERKAWSKRTR
jgi:hypothetical protein